MTLTTDKNDPRLGHGVDDEPKGMNTAYLILSEEERAKEYVRPLQLSYVHAKELGGCGSTTTMDRAIAETYARDPHFYGATYCVNCRKHLPVGKDGQFIWSWSNEKVGT